MHNDHQAVPLATRSKAYSSVTRIPYLLKPSNSSNIKVIPVRKVTKRIKGKEGQSSSKQQQQHWQQQAAAADPGFSRIAAPVHRPTDPVVGMLPDAAQLGCSSGLETAQIEDRYSRSS